jgi:soluble P-type ATPase
MMVEVPNYGEVRVDSVIFDLNGTLGESGRVNDDIKRLLEMLADKYTVVVISSDTLEHSRKSSAVSR